MNAKLVRKRNKRGQREWAPAEAGAFVMPVKNRGSPTLTVLYLYSNCENISRPKRCSYLCVVAEKVGFEPTNMPLQATYFRGAFGA